MDLREKKTKRSIANAFIALRRKKALERITVKELAELAEISKATFYLHYRDIYDLSERLQNQVIQSILANLTHPEYCLTNNRLFTEQLFYAFHNQQELIAILFSGSQSQILPQRIEAELLQYIKNQLPEMDQKTEMLVIYNIRGGYGVYQKYHGACSLEELITFTSEAAQRTFSGI